MWTPIGAKSFPTSSKNVRAGYLRRQTEARLAWRWTRPFDLLVTARRTNHAHFRASSPADAELELRLRVAPRASSPRVASRGSSAAPLEFVDSVPDPREMTDHQLVELINVLTDEEQETEYLRTVAERKVLILRDELTRRSAGDDQPG